MPNPFVAMIWNIFVTLAVLGLVAYSSEWLIELFGISERFRMWTTFGVGVVEFLIIFIPFSVSVIWRR